ncbi:MAG: FAD-dependent oxidoreductase, partial [Halieaceae bacterium]|nr:FAD-dependent oxidoreductase [Halieaceae bacterium]
EAIRNVVDVPVMVVGRLHDPEYAEEVLQKGQADLIAMARPLLADPDLPLKLQQGRIEDLRRCISCQNCVDSQQQNDDLRCAINPMAGREYEFGEARCARSKKVVVVGAGAGGMEAARQAAERGHKVVLLESQAKVGGSLVLASAVHSDNEPFLTFLQNQLQKLNIEVRLGVTATANLVSAERPDVAIIATGGKVVKPLIKGSDNRIVRTGAMLRQAIGNTSDRSELLHWPIFARLFLPIIAPLMQKLLTPQRIRRYTRWWMPVGRRVIVVGVDLAAVELAEFLTRRGRRVHLVAEGKRITPETGAKRRNEHMDRLDSLGVTVNTRIKYLRICDQGLYIEANEKEHLIPADTIILAGDVQTNSGLADQLTNRGIKAVAIGDCTGVGLIAKATHEALEVVYSV